MRRGIGQNSLLYSQKLEHFSVCGTEQSFWVIIQSMRSCQWVSKSLAVWRPWHNGGETPIISILSAALLGFLYSNCGFLSPFLLHWISQKIYQNSSHNYYGTTVNSLQFLQAQYRLVLNIAVYWPLATQLWRNLRSEGPTCEWSALQPQISRPSLNLFYCLFRMMTKENGNWCFSRPFLKLRLGDYLPWTIKRPNPIQRKTSILRIIQGARRRNIWIWLS